ncbi:PPOX class F420-dependent oxidoreductase [Streptomyces rubradiris]|uniref:PPOX class F420-dependent enzyme n=1 Tax=Streptomyces rubradiris TaxID=285531 RepID=A0ABQ3RQW1_STRRR|nr:PPOX class F420-dependent oxidoreductase [Streptomyces rubradiris]GHH24814.1 PPOX class F420-dependent enzyme [Streptomyces rubradiris]GHI58233.1 PPOX class F420-dependent enzyme [Streptomyces rubradiris]
MSILPGDRLDLLERPLFVHLATLRPDGTPQSNPMWARWDGELLWFTSTTGRRKYRNIAADPRVAVSVNDPDQPYRYLEVRGVVERVDPDPECRLFTALAERYGRELNGALPGDAPDRIAIGVRPLHASWQ